MFRNFSPFLLPLLGIASTKKKLALAQKCSEPSPPPPPPPPAEEKCSTPEPFKPVELTKSFRWNHDWDDTHTDMFNHGDVSPRSYSKLFVFVTPGSTNISPQNGTSLDLSARGIAQIEQTAERIEQLQEGLFFLRNPETILAGTDQGSKGTAKILYDYLSKEAECDSIKEVTALELNETYPCLPNYMIPQNEPPQTFTDDHMLAIAENCIETFFKRPVSCTYPEIANGKKGKPKKYLAYELFVIHPNLLRFIVTRLLQFPGAAWGRYDLVCGSITALEIFPDGAVNLLMFGASNHIIQFDIAFPYNQNCDA